MGDKTGIEWTDATWNPVTGCTEVSPGCDHCYAKTFAERWRGIPGHHFERGFDVQLRPDKLELPLRWRRPRRIFVNSMSDLFHDAVPDDYIAKVFAVMAVACDHTFQVLTKRHGRMKSLLSGDFRDQVAEEITDMMARAKPPGRYWPVTFDRTTDDGWNIWGPSIWPLPNVWLGVSAENQQWADIRIPALIETPAAIRFVSAEPLLGPIDLNPEWLAPPIGCALWDREPTTEDHAALAEVARAAVRAAFSAHPFIDWLIVGGESGHSARRMEWDWATALRDQCAAAGVAFHFKQSGAVLAREWGYGGKGGDPIEWPEEFPREYPKAVVAQ